MRIVINAGHTKLGKGRGANGFLNESIETRRIAYHLMAFLANTNHEVIPAVFDKSNDNLKEAVNLSNSKNADLFISIHLNAGGGEGVEAYTWKGYKIKLANDICSNIAKACFLKNRGVKDGSDFYVIKKTSASTTAILIECCFVDSEADSKKYTAEDIAYAIYQAIK